MPLMDQVGGTLLYVLFVLRVCVDVIGVTMPFSLSPSADLPDAVRERWEAFCASSLGETNKRNTVDLVGFTRSHFCDPSALSLCPLIQRCKIFRLSR